MEVTSYPVAILNKRGLILPLTCIHPFNFSRNEDYDKIVEYLNKDLGYKRIILAGFSLGGNVIQCYIGAKSKDNQLNKAIKLAIAISSPYCFESCSEKLDKNFIIQQGLLNRFKSYIRMNKKYPKFDEFLEDRGIKYSDLMAMKNVEDIDNFFNTKAEKCKDRFEFYEKCSGKNYLKYIDIDCLFINSENDPLIK